MKVYRGTDGDTEPIEKECEIFGYPNKTTDGEKMYDNTHFQNIEQAWDSILRSVKAGVSITGRTMEAAEKNLEEARKIAADSAKEYAIAHDKYKRWKAS